MRLALKLLFSRIINEKRHFRRVVMNALKFNIANPTGVPLFAISSWTNAQNSAAPGGILTTNPPPDQRIRVNIIDHLIDLVCVPWKNSITFSVYFGPTHSNLASSPISSITLGSPRRFTKPLYICSVDPENPRISLGFRFDTNHRRNLSAATRLHGFSRT